MSLYDKIASGGSIMLTFDTFYPSDIHITDQTLLLNIETTGLSPRNAFVFMIGLGWQEEKGWHFQCLLAEKKMDERELIISARYSPMAVTVLLTAFSTTAGAITATPTVFPAKILLI